MPSSSNPSPCTPAQLAFPVAYATEQGNVTKPSQPTTTAASTALSSASSSDAPKQLRRRTKLRLSAVQYGLLCLFLIATLWLLPRIVAAGMANLVFLPAHFSLEHWQAKPDAFLPTDFQRALNAATQAQQWQPTHPHYQVMLAKVYLWGWVTGTLTTQSLPDLTPFYQHAIERRPLWPETYADYAFYLALVRSDWPAAKPQLAKALAYGRYLPNVQRSALTVLLSQWPQLDIEHKIMAFTLAEQSVQSHPQSFVAVRDLLRQHQLTAVFCVYFGKKQATFNRSSWQRIEREICRDGRTNSR